MARGGKRIGACKPKGYVYRQTLEREAVLKRLRQRVMLHADELLNAQIAKALGSVMFFRVDEEKGADKRIKRVHTLITDPDEIKKVLDECQGGAGRVGEDYYIVTTVLADNRALDSLWDRTFGKAAQTIEIAPANPQIVDAAQKLIITLTAIGIADNAVKLQEAIKLTAQMRGLPLEPLEREVKGLLAIKEKLGEL